MTTAATEHRHDGTGATAQHHHHEYGPSPVASVMLDVGDGVGALIIITGPEWHGKEIEISAQDQDQPVRTHVAVRERPLPNGVQYCAVFPSLPAGPYVIWRTPTEPGGTVVVAPATVTELELWARP